MPFEIVMPQQTDTMTEGTLVKWHKKEGEKVKAEDEIADIETDKATMPVEAGVAGTLAHLRAQEGQKVPVGTMIAVVAKAGEDPAQVKKQYASRSAAGAAAVPAVAAASSASGEARKAASTSPGIQTLEGGAYGEMHEPDEMGHGATRQAGVATLEAPAKPGDGRGGNGRRGETGRVRISPLARRLAAENNIDPAVVQGTGPGGRIIQRDVINAVKGGGAKAMGRPAARAAVVLRGERKVTQLTKMRAAIATALQRSKQNVPHFYETIDIDMEAVSSLRERLNERLEKEKVRLSIADFVTKAVATALKEHPVLNSRFNAEKNEVTSYGDVNLGLAVALPEGLIVPVLRGADQLSLRDIRQHTLDLYEKARTQRLKKEESTEGTFTISSLGSYGIREFSAIINPPEVCILAVGAAEKRAVVDQKTGQIAARMVMTVTLSSDHRVVDGAAAAEFLRTLRELLEEPALMFI